MFDAAKFLRANFGTVGGVIAHCRAASVEPPTQAQAEKWLTRSSLTGEWLATLLAVVEVHTGQSASILPYVKLPNAQMEPHK